MTGLYYDTENEAVEAMYKYGHALFIRFPYINYIAIAPCKSRFEVKIGTTTGEPILLKNRFSFIRKFFNASHTLATSTKVLDELSEKLTNQPIKTYKSAEFGKYEYLGNNQNKRNNKLEPSDKIHGGLHIGLSKRPGGTLGGIFRLDHRSLKDEYFGISNWHVIGLGEELNSPVYQPGYPHYNESVADDDNYCCGSLCWYCLDDYREVAFVHLNPSSVEKIDQQNACGAKLTGKTSEAKYNETVSVCGQLRPNEGEVGQLETDQVFSRHAMVRITNSLFPHTEYGKNTMIFSDQILVNKLTDPGDSGSLLINNHNEVLGLVFGQTNSTELPKMTVANKIDNIFGKNFDSNIENCVKLKVNGEVHDFENFKLSTIY